MHSPPVIRSFLLAVGTGLGFATSANAETFGCWYFAGAAVVAFVGLVVAARFPSPSAAGHMEAMLDAPLP